MSSTTMSTTMAVHLGFAAIALFLGPVALGARKGSTLHRGAGHAWIVLMLGAAVSSLFLRDFTIRNVGGFTPIHLLAVFTFVGTGAGLWFIAQRKILRHKRAMWMTYLGGCVTAGVFALSPSRYLGHLVWHRALGLI